MRVYIGYDPRDELAFRACVSSLLKHSSIPLDIIPLREHDLRRAGIYNRPYLTCANGQLIDAIDSKPFSTQFSFTRFAIPLWDESTDWVMFVDADFIFFDDVAKLIALAEEDKDLMCVKHNYKPNETAKFDGMAQQQYNRKNWSSLMLMRPAKLKITKSMLNGESGSFLHGFQFMDSDKIGSLPESWNWLEGWSSSDIMPQAVHYTRGTPDLIGEAPFDGLWWDAVKEWKPDMNRTGLCG